MDRKKIYRLLTAAGIISVLSFFGFVTKDKIAPLVSPKSEGEVKAGWCAEQSASKDGSSETLFIGCNGFF